MVAPKRTGMLKRARG